MNLPAPIKALAAELAELPSIGPRQATRLAFYLVSLGQNEVTKLASAISNLNTIKICTRCFFIHQNEGALCDMCSDPKRNPRVIMVVEKETDVLSVENTGKYRGIYLILGSISRTGLLENWQKERIQNIKVFIEKELGGPADEVILGFNPTSIGNFSASLVEKELRAHTKKISRLGRGLPTGGEIEFADDDTLSAALEARN